MAAETNEEKGKTYEDLACIALGLVPGLVVKYRNRRTETSEIDIIAEFRVAPPNQILHDVGRYLLVECKNWASAAGAKHLRDFHGKLRNSKVGFGVSARQTHVASGGLNRDLLGHAY